MVLYDMHNCFDIMMSYICRQYPQGPSKPSSTVRLLQEKGATGSLKEIHIKAPSEEVL